MSKKNKTQTPDGYQQFKEDLRTDHLSRMYVLYGEESYLVDSCRKALKKKLIDPVTEDFNYHRFTQENFSIMDFQEAVEALPLMSETTMVEVTDVNIFALEEDERNAMTEILSDIPDYCTVLFVYVAVEWKADKRVSKLYAAVDKVCSQVALHKQSERELVPWIRRQLAAGKKTMKDDLCRYLIMQTGGSMTTLAAELDKLMCFTDQEEITRYDIDQVVIPVLEAMVFDITKDIFNRDFDSAMVKLKNLLQQDEEPIAINAAIGYQVRRMYAAKVLSESGKSYYDLMQLYSMKDYPAKTTYNQAKNFKKQQLRQGCRLCAEADYQMKVSSVDDAQLLENLVLQLAQLGGTA